MWRCLGFIEIFALMKRWGLGTYHGLRRKHVDSYLNEFVFRYNRRFYRHVSFETLLGIASRRRPVGYWDIAGRENPRKGDTAVRKTPRRRKTLPACAETARPKRVIRRRFSRSGQCRAYR